MTASSGITAWTEAKYYDNYANGTSTSNYTRRKLGDGTGEVGNWYSDYASFVTSAYAWFRRGGFYDDGNGAGFFSFYFNNGDSYSNVGSMVVLVSQ